MPRTNGNITVPIEISPAFALDEDEFLAVSNNRPWNAAKGLAIDADGSVTYP